MINFTTREEFITQSLEELRSEESIGLHDKKLMEELITKVLSEENFNEFICKFNEIFNGERNTQIKNIENIDDYREVMNSIIDESICFIRNCVENFDVLYLDVTKRVFTTMLDKATPEIEEILKTKKREKHEETIKKCFDFIKCEIAVYDLGGECIGTLISIVDDMYKNNPKSFIDTMTYKLNELKDNGTTVDENTARKVRTSVLQLFVDTGDYSDAVRQKFVEALSKLKAYERNQLGMD